MTNHQNKTIKQLSILKEEGMLLTSIDELKNRFRVYYLFLGTTPDGNGFLGITEKASDCPDLVLKAEVPHLRRVVPQEVPLVLALLPANEAKALRKLRHDHLRHLSGA